LLPAKRGVDNTSPRPQENRPLESWVEIEAEAGQLGPVYGPMVFFAVATAAGARASRLLRLLLTTRGGIKLDVVRVPARPQAAAEVAAFGR
jgi:hypothetical protein